MAEKSEFRYYLDTSNSAFFRRQSLCVIISICLAIDLNELMQLLAFLFPKFFSLASSATNEIQDFPVHFVVPWEDGDWLIAFITFFSLLSWLKIPRKLDFVLFSAFDEKTLQPITRYTGILQWHLPLEGEAKDTWGRLQQWIQHDIGTGRWSLEWFHSEPELKTPFAWTLLTGDNGIGKTQLAKELARELAQRDRFGDSGESKDWRNRCAHQCYRIRCWWNRVAWWRETSSHPWDVGLIRKDGLNKFAEWRPRMPTLLLLDDPGIGDCSKVITLLQEQQDNYWWPVRQSIEILRKTFGTMVTIPMTGSSFLP